MGKRKHKDRDHSRIRKRKKRDKYYRDDSYSSSDTDKNADYDRYGDYVSGPRNLRSRRDSNSSDCYFEMPLSDSEPSVINQEQLKSVVVDNAEVPAADISADNQPGPSTAPTIDQPGPSTSSEISGLPADILEALGDPKGKEEVFGPKVPEEIATRWGRILTDGLTKEKKQELTEKCLIPDNFRLAKAPLLNPEIIPVLSDPARNRDKLLEKSQNQLGLGISMLTNLTASVIEGKTEKIDLLKQISDTTQIFLDLHYEDTKRRRKLVTSSLDKKFLNMITDVKRDTHLFGVNLGDKIRAAKTAERSGLQIKRTDVVSSSKKDSNQGNWKGPPRSHSHRGYRQGGQKSRGYWSQANRRPPAQQTARQPQSAAKPNTKTSKA